MRFVPVRKDIRAFLFEGKDTKPPSWFLEAYHRGDAMVTINNRDQYIIIRDGMEFRKAFAGDWIAIKESGRIFVLPDSEIKSDYVSME